MAIDITAIKSELGGQCRALRVPDIRVRAADVPYIAAGPLLSPGHASQPHNSLRMLLSATPTAGLPKGSGPRGLYV